MKEDERQLLNRFQADWTRFPIDHANDMGMHPKRANYLFEKWIDKGWLECGVTARTGWLTEEGKKV